MPMKKCGGLGMKKLLSVIFFLFSVQLLAQSRAPAIDDFWQVYPEQEYAKEGTVIESFNFEKAGSTIGNSQGSNLAFIPFLIVLGLLALPMMVWLTMVRSLNNTEPVQNSLPENVTSLDQFRDKKTLEQNNTHEVTPPTEEEEDHYKKAS